MKEQILAVQRMQDYIIEHYDSEITLADLSKVSLFCLGIHTVCLSSIFN